LTRVSDDSAQLVDAAAFTLGLPSSDKFTSDDVDHLLDQYRGTLEPHGYREMSAAVQQSLPSPSEIVRNTGYRKRSSAAGRITRGISTGTTTCGGAERPRARR
jgi:hypothetical protein